MDSAGVDMFFIYRTTSCLVYKYLIWCINIHTDKRIQSYPDGDYSIEIPQISFAGFMLNKMKEYGNEIACVSY